MEWHFRKTLGVGGTAHDICVGDANNDGYNDVVCADDDDATVFLWDPLINDWAPRIDLDATWCRGVSLGDANNDGHNDIVATRVAFDMVYIFLWNTSTATWNSALSRGVGDGPTKVVVADANNDGQNEIVTVNSNTNNVSVLVWNATSQKWDTNLNLTAGPSGGNINSVSVADANNDGQNDIVTCTYDTNQASVLLWNTTLGSWNSYFSLSVGLCPSEVVVGDANNDGQNDIVTVNNGNETISIILWNKTSWTWDPQLQKAAGPAASSVFIGDVTNDGLNDIYPVGDSPMTEHGAGYIWNKNSKDWDVISHDNYGYHTDIFIGDANNDGQNDLVAAFYLYAAITLQFADDGDWDPLFHKSAGIQAESVTVGDANNDGYKDVVSVSQTSDLVAILLWNPTTWDWDDAILKSAGFGMSRPIIGDANNDGQNDIVVSNYDTHSYTIFLWNRTHNDWNKNEIYLSDVDTEGVVIGDANNDGQNDLVSVGGLGGFGGNVTVLLWNATHNNWSQEIKRSVGFLPYGCTVSDVNNDGQNDILNADLFNKTISILLWNTTLNNWNPRKTLNVTGELFWVAVGDVNIDGYTDIVAANYIWQANDVLSIFLWNETSGEWDTVSKSISGDIDGLLVNDINNDGENEMVTFSTIDKRIIYYSWNELTTDWDSDSISTRDQNPRDATIGDVNNDGKVDIVIVSTSNVLGIILWNLDRIPGGGGIPGFGVSFALIGLLALTIIALKTRRENIL